MKVSGLQLFLAASAASLLSAATVTWRNSTASHPVPVSARTSQVPHQVNLDFRLAEFHVESETLNQVIDDLASKTGENFAVDWASLSYGDSALSRQTVLPVTLKLKNVTLRDALDALIHRLSANPYEISYEANDGIVTINRFATSYRVPSTKVYDVRDLIDRQRAAMHQRNLPTNKSPALMDEPATEYQAAADWIIATANDLASHGNAEARFSELAGRLIVTTTPENHERIQQLFADLRRN